MVSFISEHAVYSPWAGIDAPEYFTPRLAGAAVTATRLSTI